jgi:hypothetical protein
MTADTAAIIGRTTERRQVVDFVDAVAAGPVALLLEGEPGIGKTTVWAEGVGVAAERAYHVVSCRPVEAETQLGYAALGDMLAAVPEGVVARLPSPQRHAIDVALLRAEPEGEGSRRDRHARRPPAARRRRPDDRRDRRRTVARPAFGGRARGSPSGGSRTSGSDCSSPVERTRGPRRLSMSRARFPSRDTVDSSFGPSTGRRAAGSSPSGSKRRFRRRC